MPPKTNPFSKPEAIKPRVKAVLRGPMGSGKTFMALKSPGRIAVIDTEGAAQWYVGRPGFEEFDIVKATNYADVVNAVDWLAAHAHDPDFPYKDGTLVIDSASIVYTRLQDSATAARTAQALNKGIDPMDVDIEGRDWNKISRLSKTLGAKLIDLPMHVIVITREKEKKNKQGDVVDYLPDAAKGLESDFALVVRLQMKGPRRVATLIKDWTGVHGAMSEIEDPTWATVFGPLLKVRSTATAAPRAVVDDVEKDAATFGAKLASPDKVALLYTQIEAAGYDPEVLRASRGWPEFSQMPSDMVEQLLAWARARIPNAGANGGEADPTPVGSGQSSSEPTKTADGSTTSTTPTATSDDEPSSTTSTTSPTDPTTPPEDTSTGGTDADLDGSDDVINPDAPAAKPKRGRRAA